MELSNTTTTMAGILLLSLITVESGGAFLLRVARGDHEATDVQRSFFRAGHAHAGVFLVLALVCQLFVDAADLPGPLAAVARSGVAVAAILMPAGFFLSVIRVGAERPSRLVALVPAGGACLTAGLAVLGIGLLAA